MPSSLPAPLGGPPPDEISLPRAPLARVLTQVRFPTILKIEQRESIIPFQEAIREQYPLLQQEMSEQFRVEITQAGQTMRPQTLTVWRLLDATQIWRVSLGNDFLTLETRHYVSRNDFLERLTVVLEAVERAFNPQIALRIGMRYVDRIVGSAYEEIETMIRSDLLGVAMPPLRQHVRHAMNEALLPVAEGEMMLRWGILPANGTMDPNVLEPIPEQSWILDIDVSSSEARMFVHQQLATSFRALAQRAYSVFRFMTKDEAFTRMYGGKL